MHSIYKILAKIELASYEDFKRGKKITIYYYPFFLIKGILNLFESLIRHVSGPIGFIIRRFYYKMVFKKMGKDVLIDTGVYFSAPQNIKCGDRVWFDVYSIINSPICEFEIGSQVHIGPHSYMGGKKKIILKNFCALSAGSKIFSGSTNIPLKKLLISNPMLIEKKITEKKLNDADVVLEENSVVLSNCVVTPGVKMGKGSMLLPNSFLNKSTEEYCVYIGTPAKFIAKRM
jgi:galactoside O-acetyltransferase